MEGVDGRTGDAEAAEGEEEERVGAAEGVGQAHEPSPALVSMRGPVPLPARKTRLKTRPTSLAPLRPSRPVRLQPPHLLIQHISERAKKQRFRQLGGGRIEQRGLEHIEGKVQPITH